MPDVNVFVQFLKTAQSKVRLFDWLNSDAEIRAYVQNCLKADESGYADEIDDPLGDEDHKLMALHVLKAAYRYDDEAIEGDESYTHLIESFAELAGTDFRPQQIQAKFDDMDEEWTIRLSVNGRKHEFSLDYFGDFVPNEELVESLNQILRKQSAQGRFYLVGSGEPTIMYLRPVQWELNRQTRFLPAYQSSAEADEDDDL
jgi:hypothetical protein